MKRFSRLAIPLGSVIVGTASAHAALLFDSGFVSLSSGDSTQTGRLSRSGVQSDWSALKVFPGTINTTTSYHYHVYDFAVTNTPFLEVTFDSPAATIFASAYQTSYNPASESTHYLGDAGSSGNYFGTDPISFQVTAASNSHVEVVVNESVTNGGLNSPYRIIVQGFTDTNYSEPTPEPASLCVLGLGALAMLRKRRSA